MGLRRGRAAAAAPMDANGGCVRSCCFRKGELLRRLAGALGISGKPGRVGFEDYTKLGWSGARNVIGSKACCCCPLRAAALAPLWWCWSVCSDLSSMVWAAAFYTSGHEGHPKVSNFLPQRRSLLTHNSSAHSNQINGMLATRAIQKSGFQGIPKL